MGLRTRKNQRLRDYDYRQAGAYFVTICIKDKRCLLGNVVKNASSAPSVQLSSYGQIVHATIQEIPAHYEGVTVNKYVIMPNHLHMILFLGAGGALGSARPTDESESMAEPEASQCANTSLSIIIAAFKRMTGKAVGSDLWQASFYDHVIRNEKDYQRIGDYLDANPQRWAEDRFFVA